MSDPVIAALRDQRMHLALTQRDLAAALGVQQSSISDWESGTVVPRLTTLHRWAEALGLAIIAQVEELRGQRDEARRMLRNLTAVHDRMRPVVEAAEAWHVAGTVRTESALEAAVDAWRAAQPDQLRYPDEMGWLVDKKAPMDRPNATQVVEAAEAYVEARFTSGAGSAGNALTAAVDAWRAAQPDRRITPVDFGPHPHPMSALITAAVHAARDAFDLECSKVLSVLDDPDEAEGRPWRAAIAAACSSALREAADEMENAIITRLSAAWPTIFGDDETFTEQVAREILALLRERAGRIGGGE